MTTQKLFNKNFSLLVLGQVSSLFGNTILRFALSMYVLEITGSATIFAGILAVAMIPTIILSPLGGILADRANRRNIMVALDVLSAIVVFSALLFVSADTNLILVTVILIALAILGAFESPTVQAAVPQMHQGDNLIRANAVIVQVIAIAGLIAPILGGVLYATFGLKTVLIVTAFSFCLTALLECFITLPFKRPSKNESLSQIIKNDFAVSMKFICKEQPDILKLLLLVALVSFFIMGIAAVGLPYIIRNVLNLSAQYYAVAESLFGVAAIIGSIFAGFLITRLRLRKVYLVLSALGAAILPAGVIFLFVANTMVYYAVIVAAMCLAQFVSCIFSIFALSAVQQRTPNELLGKIMAYVATITMCAQPLGQMIYGFLFDTFAQQLYLILIPSAAVIAIIGIFSKNIFNRLDN